MLGTQYHRPQDVTRSATVHNLGYDGVEREAYPWVAEMSADDATFAAARRRRPAPVE